MDCVILRVPILTLPQFASDTGTTGQWRTPSAGEVASDFDDFNADGSVKEGVYDATKKPEDEEEFEDDHPKGRKAKKVATEYVLHSHPSFQGRLLIHRLL